MSFVHNLSYQINIFFLYYLSNNIILQDSIKLPGYVKRDNAQKEAMKTELRKEHEHVLDCCDKFSKTLGSQNIETENLLRQVTSSFSASVDLIISVEMSSYLETMAREDYETTLRCLTSLAMRGNHLCRLMVNQGVVATLLKVLKTKDIGQQNRILTLRALGCVCCVAEGIRELVVMNGLDIIVDNLENVHKNEDEKREVVGVLAQVTSPWIEGNMCVEGIKRHTGSILHSIKG